MSMEESSEKEAFKLDPVWEINIPQPDHVLPISPSQNVAQAVKEVDDTWGDLPPASAFPF